MNTNVYIIRLESILNKVHTRHINLFTEHIEEMQDILLLVQDQNIYEQYINLINSLEKFKKKIINIEEEWAQELVNNIIELELTLRKSYIEFYEIINPTGKRNHFR